MIAIDQTSRWIRELARFVPVKHALFLYGNVHDLVSYPVIGEQDQSYWVSGDLQSFLSRYLIDLGYEVIGQCDAVDGLTFVDPQMELTYRLLAAGKTSSPPSKSQQDRAGGWDQSVEPARGRGAASSNTRASRSNSVDIDASIPGIRSALSNTQTPSAFIFQFASRLVSSPAHLLSSELRICTQLLKAALEAQEVKSGDQRRKNLLIFTCEKLNDLPAFLYVNNPRARTIAIDKPDSLSRSRMLRANYRSFFEAAGDSPSPELESRFATLTEGMSHYEILSLVDLSRVERIAVTDTRRLLERYKYGVTESEWDKIGKSRLDQAKEIIGRRVLGQDAALARVLDLIKRARAGIVAGSRSQRPRGVLFFAGPTGVGKTELAKGLSELLFGQEERLIRFDMSEYSAPHSDEKLLGAPPSYVGYEEGGQLTNAIKAHPFSILLFDEIEKAHPSIFDKFLQILDDGRLTDGKGETVYFSESIIIFTSNLGTVDRSSQHDTYPQQLVTPEKSYPEVRKLIQQAIRDHFNLVLGRPEILNRFGDNFVVFDYIRPPVDAAIVDLLLEQLKRAFREQRRIELKVDPRVSVMLTALGSEQLHHGGRGIRNMVDAALVNPLARWLFDHDILNDARLTIKNLSDHGEEAEYRFELEVDKTE